MRGHDDGAAARCASAISVCSTAMARSSSAVNGSSNSSTSGSCMKARATARRCRMPRENSRTRPSRTRSSPVRSSHSMRRFARVVKAVELREQHQIFGGGQFVVERNSVAQHADPPPRGSSRTRRRRYSNAALRWASTSPAMIRSSVVLPAPLRPSSATVEPARRGARCRAGRGNRRNISRRRRLRVRSRGILFRYSSTPPSAKNREASGPAPREVCV